MIENTQITYSLQYIYFIAIIENTIDFNVVHLCGHGQQIYSNRYLYSIYSFWRPTIYAIYACSRCYIYIYSRTVVEM